MRISLRLKLALISLLLLIIPLLGLRLNSSLKSSLIASQEDALSLTAHAVSAALNNRSDLFQREKFYSLQQDRDVYLFQLSNPIQLNGEIDDWMPEFGVADVFGAEHLLAQTTRYDPADLSFSHLAGKQGDYLYALFDIRDDHVTYRSQDTLRLDRSDHLQIIVDSENIPQKYIVTCYEPGWVIGFLVPEDPFQFPSIEKRIHGRWKETDKGYTLEIRIHSDLLGSKFAFAVADVDDAATGTLETLIGTANLEENNEPGWLLAKSTATEEILKSLDRPYARIRVLDRNKRVRAEVGELGEAPKHSLSSNQTIDTILTRVHRIFQPVYRFFTTPFSANLEKSESQPTVVDLLGVPEAFNGNGSIVRYQDKDGPVEVMAAITPVFENGEVIAVVVVEQTTNSILSLSNQLIEETISLSILAFLLGGGALFLYAFRISARIRKLRNQSGASITGDGKVINTIQASHTKDEIGDLERTLNSMLIQLQEQISYREKMADNLEHEMRTPLAGVAASLNNIESEIGTDQSRIIEYLDGARHNTQRLDDLLTTIREATTLKDSLSQDSMQPFDMCEALSMWLKFSWKRIFPDVEFIFEAPAQPIKINGDPVLLHQAFDKLVENAVSYHRPGTPIELIISRDKDSVSFKISNQGKTINPALHHQIFNYMFSSRVSTDTHPHLGLGLYITKTILKHHGGKITVNNLQNGMEGVVFTATLPAIQ